MFSIIQGSNGQTGFEISTPGYKITLMFEEANKYRFTDYNNNKITKVGPVEIALYDSVNSILLFSKSRVQSVDLFRIIYIIESTPKPKITEKLDEIFEDAYIEKG